MEILSQVIDCKSLFITGKASFTDYRSKLWAKRICHKVRKHIITLQMPEWINRVEKCNNQRRAVLLSVWHGVLSSGGGNAFDHAL